MTVADILKKKSNSIHAVTGSISVFDALKLMGEKNIGALVVVEDNELKGIISERDYARKIILKGRTSLDTTVSEIMTQKVITVTAENDLDQCMEIMSQRDIRHLPVLEGSTVVGMISIGDVVKAVIAAQKETIEHLKNYISQ